MLPFLNLFGLALPMAPFIILLGIWFGLSLTEKHAHRHKLNPDILYNLAFAGLIAGVLGARLSYVVQFPAAFISDPSSLISINFGLFDPIGGAVVGLLVAFIYGQRKKLPLWQTIDAFTPLFTILMVAIPLANLASGSAFGSESKLPWAIELWGASRHPVQIYEAIGAILILWFFWPSKISVKRTSGAIFLQFIVITAFARVFFEVFRGDSLITVYNLRTAQLLAWVIMAIGIWGFTQISRKRVNKK